MLAAGRMDFQAQPPLIRTVPADPAASTTNQTSKSSRRRTSLPAPIQTSDVRSKKQSSNYIRTQAASPQVISSLIDQLSALSIPAHNHFENLLTGYESLSIPPSPSARSYSERQSLHDAGSTHSSSYYNSIRDVNDLYPEDACEPPVVRTSKPPSGKSSITAPKKRDKQNGLSNYLHRSASTASLRSVRSHRSQGSIGNISIEAIPPAAPKQAPSESTRSSGESKRSGKGHRSLMYMSSRERLKQKETERKRNTVHALEKTPSAESQVKTTTLLFPYEDTIKEEPATPFWKEGQQQAPANEVTRFAQRNKSRNSSPRRLRLNLVDGPPADSPTDKGIIPERGSSLRHSGSPSRKSKKAQGKESTRQKSPPSQPVMEKDEKMDEEAQMKEKILSELEKEEDDVARRIRELREQKMRRDKLAGKMPVENTDADAGATTSTLANGRVSSVPDPEPSPTFTVSPESERRVQDPTKAHKVLGIAREVIPVEETADKLSSKMGIGGELETIPISQTRSSRHARHRSLTVNDGEDTTPLPINYALALRRLDEVAPAPLSPLLESNRPKDPSPRSISTTSTKGTASSSDSTTPKRAQSMAVGGRSAVVRRSVTASVVMGSTPGHKHSTSTTDLGSETSAPPVRSPSEEISNRHKSMHATSTPASNSLKLQRRRTLTKKRWSHPDLPAKAEKQHNAKVDRSEAKAEAKAAAAAAAVQSPPQPVVEDRPTSSDSIDLEVENYLNSPRLSQTIRHPQTGRIISFSEVGDPHGYAVFVCVGMGLTRYVMAFYDQLALTLKLRMITPDRPGIGGSQVDQNGTPLSWPGK